MIGLLLAGVAVILVRESRGLLIGEGIRPTKASEVRAIATRQPAVLRAGQTLSMYIGRKEVLLTLDVEFKPGTPGDEIVSTVQTIEATIRKQFPLIRRIYIEAQHLAVAKEGPATESA